MNRWTQAYWARKAISFVWLHKQAHKEGLPPNVQQAIAEATRAIAHVGNLLKGSEEPAACEECGGVGILFAPSVRTREDQFSRPPTIERCDACKQFASDNEAMAELRIICGDVS